MRGAVANYETRVIEQALPNEEYYASATFYAPRSVVFRPAACTTVGPLTALNLSYGKGL